MEKEPLMRPQTIYRELVNESTGGPRDSISTPRDPTQVRNFRKEINDQLRLSHDAFFNTYHLTFQLFMTSRKGTNHEFIKYFSVHPTIVVHLVAQPLVEALEVVLKSSTDTLLLHYDTVFNIGDFYMSTILFRHTLFEKSPVIPFAFLIHSRRYLKDHKVFLEFIRQSLPLLASKQIVTNVLLLTKNLNFLISFRLDTMYSVGIT